MPTRQGSFHLFRLFGVDVFLHWWWFLVAVYEIQSRAGRYSSLTWNVLEYLALFLIVLMHEFGHALACRQVGGKADRIVLWPLGGAAYVDPPQRPGATLWSIAAGPLVNVALMPVLALLFLKAQQFGGSRDLVALLYAIGLINRWLLAFNILPIYPLDGGQILRSLLWFFLGRGRSLMVATLFGFVGVAGLAALAVYERSLWTAAITFYVATSCWASVKASQSLVKLDKLPRRQGYACPNCHAAPPMGRIWMCDLCSERFDPFESAGQCPNCGKRHANTMCVECNTMSPLDAWGGDAAARFAHPEHSLQPETLPIPD